MSPRRTHLIARLMILLALGSLLAGGAGADTVTLRPWARLGGANTVTLEAIADLVGDDAKALGDVEIVANPKAQAAGKAWLEISIDQVRSALDDRRVNWGRISLRGTTCEVHVAVASARRDDRASVLESESAPTPREPTTVDLTGPATVRTRVVSLLASLYHAEPDQLRVLFDNADKALLDTPQENRRIEVQPTANASSSRFTVIVWIYTGDQLTESRTLRIDLRVRRAVVVVAADRQRGETIEPDHLRQETMWIKPTGAPLVPSIEEAAGSIAKRRLVTGSVLRSDMIEPPIVVRRGELTIVHCLSGGVVVKAKARARADARQGDVIEFQLEGSKRTFRARVVGVGRAILNLDWDGDEKAG